MKTPVLFLVLAAAMLLGGCYTQLALTDDEPEVVVGTQTPEIIQPPPIVIIWEPVPYPVPPSYSPPPMAGASAPGVVAQPQPESPSRDIGNHRSDSGRSETASSDTRTAGSTRAGR